MNQSSLSKRVAALVSHTSAFRIHNDVAERKQGRFVSATAVLQGLPSKDESMAAAERTARRASRRMAFLLGWK